MISSFKYHTVLQGQFLNYFNYESSACSFQTHAYDAISDFQFLYRIYLEIQVRWTLYKVNANSTLLILYIYL